MVLNKKINILNLRKWSSKWFGFSNFLLPFADPMVVDEEPKWYQLQEMEDPEAPPSISGKMLFF